MDLLLFSGGRDANSDGLDLEVVQVDVGKYGRIVVDPSTFHTTSQQSIYAIGDVIGPPGLGIIITPVNGPLITNCSTHLVLLTHPYNTHFNLLLSTSVSPTPSAFLY